MENPLLSHNLITTYLKFRLIQPKWKLRTQLKIFKVDVKSVNTLNQKGKKKGLEVKSGSELA